MSLKRVLVTGGGGFIGRCSVAPLLARGYEVHAVLSASLHHRTPAELRGAAIHHADLLDGSQVDALLERVRPSHLLHFAWIATPGVYWQSPDNARWLAASQHLLREFQARDGARAVMAGSCVEYDWSQGGICEEESNLADADGPAQAGAANLTPYAAAKIALQRHVAEFSLARHFSSAWGRIFFQYGPHEHPDRLVPSVIRHLLMNQEALCTHGRQIRSFLHVADVGAAFAGLLDSEVQGPVNIGSDERIALADLIERIARDIGRPELIRLGARSAPAAEPPVLLPDVRRLRNEVHWRPRFTLDEGIADTIAWWRGQSALAGGA
jgi:nucleoside-diphosphate-sugar epimerase